MFYFLKRNNLYIILLYYNMANFKFIPAKNFKYIGKLYYKNKEITKLLFIIYFNPIAFLIFINLIEFRKK